ncbi:MAG: hypothetical protein ACYTDY_14725 [Planctomycetota bacterium]
MWGRALVACVAVLIAVGTVFLADRARRLDRIADDLDREIEAAERETHPRPPLFGDPVPGTAVGWYSSAARSLPRCYEELATGGPADAVKLRKVYELVSLGTRTAEAGRIWNFRRVIVRPEAVSPDPMLGLAMIQEARRLSAQGRLGNAVDRLLELVRYAQDLRRCGGLDRSDWILIEASKAFSELAPRLPSAEIQRAYGVLRRELAHDPERSIERTQFLLARQSMRHAVANWGLSKWQGSRWGRILWDRTRPPWPLRRQVYRTLELWHLPEALRSGTSARACSTHGSWTGSRGAPLSPLSPT